MAIDVAERIVDPAHLRGRIDHRTGMQQAEIMACRAAETSACDRRASPARNIRNASGGRSRGCACGRDNARTSGSLHPCRPLLLRSGERIRAGKRSDRVENARRGLSLPASDATASPAARYTRPASRGAKSQRNRRRSGRGRAQERAAEPDLHDPVDMPAEDALDLRMARDDGSEPVPSRQS